MGEKYLQNICHTEYGGLIFFYLLADRVSFDDKKHSTMLYVGSLSV